MKYKDAGVDISRAEKLKSWLKDLFGETIGPYAGTFSLGEKLLVASSDGIGTKLKLMARYRRMKEAAQDLVAMNVNDIFCLGAKPLFFLDYVGCHRIEIELLQPFFESLKALLDSLHCQLLGGETAEMPSVYPEGSLDLVGFIVGIVDTSDHLPFGPEKVKAGDLAIALPSSGPHSNGYSLINKLLQEGYLQESDQALMESLLQPTKIYRFEYLEGIHACAHITGGGLSKNLLRIIPEGLKLDFKVGEIPEVFEKIRKAGKIPLEEMLQTFNMGTGFVLIVDPEKAEEVLKNLAIFQPRIAGKVSQDEKGSRLRIW
ncbi:MAG: phosphoribosylformylglycinamidine cyclo-ligase [Coprothermobacterota bacterium]|nr:phosphoribosylformylglycinamidine cyclo-ligase [Coprothermobacterota bacterium]